MKTKNDYIKSILKTIAIAGVAMLVAKLLFGNMEGTTFLIIAAFAGIPFGWSAMIKVLHGLLAFGAIGAVLYYIFMFALSAAIGWIIMIVRLVKDLFCLGKLIYTEKMENKTVV